MKSFIFIIFSFNVAYLFPQETDLVTHIFNLKESGFSNLEVELKIDSIIQGRKVRRNKIELADFYHDIGNKWYYRSWLKKRKETRLLDSAIQFTSRAVRIKLDIDTLNLNSKKKSLYNLGYFLSKNEKLFQSIEAYLKLTEFEEIDRKTILSFYRLGNLYQEVGDFFKSISAFKSFVTLSDQKELLLDAHLELAYTLSLMDYLTNYDEVQSTLEDAEKFLDLEEESEMFYRTKIEQLRGNLYLMNEEYQKALVHLTKSLTYSKGLSNYHQAIIINSIGVSYSKINRLESAISQFEKSIGLDSLYSDPFENLGDIYCTQGNFIEGIRNYKIAVEIAIGKKLNPTILSLPNRDDLELVVKKTDVLSHLVQKANAWLDYYKHDGNQEHLNHALTTFERADELIDIIRSQSTEYQSKLYWRGQSSKLYMKAVEVSFLLDKPEKAYYFMERNKALLLLEDITHEKAKELSQLPDSMAKREFELKRAIHLAENTLQNSTSASQDSVQNLKNEIFQYKRNYEKYMDSLTIAFPDYARLKQQFQVLSYQDFKSNFGSEETGTLQFILNDEQGYALLHANGKPQFYELENAGVLNENLLKFYASLSSFDQKIEEAKRISNAIFKTLLPSAAFETIKNKQLIIVPDYNLQKIPFEALVTNLIDQRYLLEDTELRYAYSLSYLDAKKQVQTQAEEDLLALAPVDFENLGLAKLGFSGLEVDALKSIFGGETWLNEEASKENLLKNLNKHGILHFATHADIDDNGNHWVAFSDDKLYLNEIYATRNQAEMVVLSACNTSRGELKNGEGVMSLARAFFNAGAKSVVSSLWPTVDKTSKDIMIDFYQGLEEGLPKATALRNAKLNYLKAKPEASPAQWAALIVIGDNAPVKKPNFIGDNWPWMAFAGGLLLIPVFLWKRNRKQAA